MQQASCRPALLLSFALLTGCPASTGTATTTRTGTDSTDVGQEVEAGRHDRGGRTDLRREGLVAAGDYLFDLPSAAAAGGGGIEVAGTERRGAHLRGIVGGELEILDGTAAVRLSREVAWPMLCLRAATTFTDGALRVVLSAGAPVYVLASDATGARVSTAVGTQHSRVVDRSELALEDCAEPGTPEGSQFVGTPQHAADAPCLFTDPDPVDESDGLPVAAGAALQTLEEDGDWARVRVIGVGSRIEGWIPSALVATSASVSPDWNEAGLRAGRCSFPGRVGETRQSEAWIEASDASMPAFPPSHFEPAMRAGEPAVRQCWTETLARNPGHPAARVEVRIVVDGDGQVERAEVTSRRGAEDALARCVLQRVSRIRFPPPRSGVTLRRRYDFEPTDAAPTDAAPTDAAPTSE